jgi:hypothetical protein
MSYFIIKLGRQVGSKFFLDFLNTFCNNVFFCYFDYYSIEYRNYCIPFVSSVICCQTRKANLQNLISGQGGFSNCLLIVALCNAMKASQIFLPEKKQQNS